MTELNRRQLLKLSAGTIMTMGLSGCNQITSAEKKPQTQPEIHSGKLKLICIEEHILDRDLTENSMQNILAEAAYMADWGKDVQDGNNPDRSRPQIASQSFIGQSIMEFGEKRIADMDKADIAMQVLSYGGAPQFAPEHHSGRLDRQANDRLAQGIADNPTRFAGFASLPWANPDLAVKELERAVKQLGLKGALLNGRPSADFLDAPKYAELLSAFNELQVPLFLHPGIPMPQVQQAYYGGFNREVSARLSMFGWGWHHEAGIQLLRLILAGTFDRNPNLNVISGHWGEMLPFYLQRLDDSIPQQASGLNRSITQTFKEQVYVTPSGMLTLPHFEFIYKLMGAERILYSVDYPYQSLDGVQDFIQNLPISQQEKVLIANGNAKRLLTL